MPGVCCSPSLNFHISSIIFERDNLQWCAFIERKVIGRQINVDDVRGDQVEIARKCKQQNIDYWNIMLV